VRVLADGTRIVKKWLPKNTYDNIMDIFDKELEYSIDGHGVSNCLQNKYICKLCGYSFHTQLFGAPIETWSAAGDRAYIEVKEKMKEHLIIKHDVKL